MPEAEKAEALGMAQRWQQLVVDGKTRDLRLLLVKDQFREVNHTHTWMIFLAYTRRDSCLRANVSCLWVLTCHLSHCLGRCVWLQVTKQQAVDFQEELKDLRRAFYAKGPGAAGVDLEVSPTTH